MQSRKGKRIHFSLISIIVQKGISLPRNPLLAQVFYYAELVEKWGTGTIRIAQMLARQNLPEPQFISKDSAFTVKFSKDPYTEDRLRKIGLNERQIKSVRQMKQIGSLSSKEYQEFTGIKERMAVMDLNDLVKKGVLIRAGKVGRGLRYTLNQQNPQ